MRYFAKDGHIIATDEKDIQDSGEYPLCVVRYCRPGDISQPDNGDPWPDPWDTWTTEKKWDCIRLRRNALLKQCDWTQGETHMTAAQKQAWKDYRKVLSDIETTYDDPDDVIFPAPPGL